jgi:hypothetical protein
MAQAGPSETERMTSDSMPPINKEGSFPATLEFVGEGSANVVFAAQKTHARCPPGRPTSFDLRKNELTSSAGFLLRLQKPNTQAHDYISQNIYCQKFIKPLFGEEQLVQQKVELIVAYDDWDIVSDANNVLAQLDRSGRRRAKFLGTRVAKTESVLLVEDMRSRTSSA